MKTTLLFLCVAASLLAQSTNINGSRDIAGSLTVHGPINLATGGGAAQAQTATLAGTQAALTNGLQVCWLPANANSGAAPTLALNALTATAIVKAGGTALVANDLVTTQKACAIYNSTGPRWELQNPATGGGGAATNGTNGQGLTSNGSGGFGAPVTLAPSATTDTTSATNITSGTLPSGRLPTQLYSTAPNVGAMLAVGLADTTTANSYEWGGNAANGCQGRPVLIPASGTIRSLNVLTSTAEGSGARTKALVSVNCFASNSNGNAMPGGVNIYSGQAAGVYANSWANDYWHLNQFSDPGFQFNRTGSGGTSASIRSASAEFVADSGTVTPIMEAVNNAHIPTASTTSFSCVVAMNTFTNCDYNATELTTAVPIPFAGTLQSAAITLSIIPAASATWTLRVNSASPVNGITITTPSGDTAPATYMDATHTVSVNQGDYIDWQVVSGAGAQLLTYGISEGLTPTSGSHTAIFFVMATINGTTASYLSAQGVSANSATEATAQVPMPFACAATNLYGVLGSSTTQTTTITLEQNGADTALTGTVSSGASTGAIALDTTHTVNLAKGDTISLKVVTTGGGASGTFGGFALQCN